MSKKTIAFTLFILCGVVVASAQESSSNKIISRFELVGGPSISSNTGYLNDYDSKTGYSFGFGYYQPVFKSVSLNFRSLYESKGSVGNYKYGLTDANGTVNVNDQYTTKLKYISLYLLPTLQLGRNKNIHLSAGGYYSFLQSVSVNTYSTNQQTGEVIKEYTDTRKNYFKPEYDAGLSFQLGYSFNVSEKAKLMLQAYSNRGLVDMHNNAFGSQRNNTYGLTLSLRMR